MKYASCVIYHDHSDRAFARQLSADLQRQGIRCWEMSDDLYLVDDACRQRMNALTCLHGKLVLILSESSIWCTWLKEASEIALRMERGQQKQLLIPVQLDNSLVHLHETWFIDMSRTRSLVDFTRWEDHNAYQESIQRLLHDLEAEPISHDEASQAVLS